jgi:chromosome segregation ATPase
MSKSKSKCWSCGDTGSSAIRDADGREVDSFQCPYCEEIEFAELRAKLATAEEKCKGEFAAGHQRGKLDQFAAGAARLDAATDRAEKAELAAQEQRLLTETVRAGMQSLGRALEDCRLDKHAVEVERDALKAAVEKLDADLRFQRNDRDHWHREDGLKSVKLAEAKFSAEKAESKLAEAITRAEAAEVERDALAAQNARLRAELKTFANNSLVGAIGREEYAILHEDIVDWFSASDFLRSAEVLNLTPPAALEELRRREREAALRDVAFDLGRVHGEWRAASIVAEMAEHLEQQLADAIRDAREKGGAE